MDTLYTRKIKASRSSQWYTVYKRSLSIGSHKHPSPKSQRKGSACKGHAQQPDGTLQFVHADGVTVVKARFLNLQLFQAPPCPRLRVAQQRTAIFPFLLACCHLEGAFHCVHSHVGTLFRCRSLSKYLFCATSWVLAECCRWVSQVWGAGIKSELLCFVIPAIPALLARHEECCIFRPAPQ